VDFTRIYLFSLPPPDLALITIKWAGAWKIFCLITGKRGFYNQAIIACIVDFCNQTAMHFANVLVYFIPSKNIILFMELLRYGLILPYINVCLMKYILHELRMVGSIYLSNEIVALKIYKFNTLVIPTPWVQIVT
jgi:hypothetical protein